MLQAAALDTRSTFMSGRAVAVGMLCRIYCMRRRRAASFACKPDLEAGLADFYSALSAALTDSHPKGAVVGAALVNCTSLFPCALPGLHGMRPAFLHGIERMIMPKPPNVTPGAAVEEAAIRVLLNMAEFSEPVMSRSRSKQQRSKHQTNNQSSGGGGGGGGGGADDGPGVDGGRSRRTAVLTILTRGCISNHSSVRCCSMRGLVVACIEVLSRMPVEAKSKAGAEAAEGEDEDGDSESWRAEREGLVTTALRALLSNVTDPSSIPEDSTVALDCLSSLSSFRHSLDSLTAVPDAPTSCKRGAL